MIMLSSKEILMLLEATGPSIYMTLVSTLMAYVIGLPVGVLLVVCAPGGLKPKKALYKILDIIVNITRLDSVFDTDDTGDAAGAPDSRKILWCKCNHYFADAGSCPVCGEACGILSSGGGQGCY